MPMKQCHVTLACRLVSFGNFCRVVLRNIFAFSLHCFSQKVEEARLPESIRIPATSILRLVRLIISQYLT
jgi:hypothetical protein